MIYCYQCLTCGERASKNLPIRDAGLRPLCPGCGAQMERDWQTEHAGPDTRSGCDNWRNFSPEALAVHPSQAAEADEWAAKHGMHVHHRRDDGRPVFQSKRTYKQYCERQGFYARNGGYGDPQKRR